MTHSQRTLLLTASITPLRASAKPSPDAGRLLELDYLADAGDRFTVTPKGRAALAATRGQALLSPDADGHLATLKPGQAERLARAVLKRPLRRERAT
jgi:hypothetical protein